MIGIRVDDDLHLALPLDRHAEPLFAMIDAERDRIQEWVDVSTTRTVADQRALLVSERQSFGAGRGYPFVIEAAGEVAGTLNLFLNAGRTHVAEIGYLLGQRFEGRGIVTRAASALVDEAFDRLGLHRLEIRASPENVRSCAVPRRLGFREEGITRSSAGQNGGYGDEIMFAMLVGEWRSGV